MTAFLISAGLAFAIYQLLAFARIPAMERRRRFFRIFGFKITYTEQSARMADIFARAVMVFAIGFSVVLIHRFISPLDEISRYRVNIYVGFLSGPLLAIWVNSVVLHPPLTDLSRGQLVGGVGLVLLFLLGAAGDEMANLVSRYAHNIKALKLSGAELSFADKTPKDTLAATPPAGLLSTFVSGGSNGLVYFLQLGESDGIIARDRRYLRLLGGEQVAAAYNLRAAEDFATDVTDPPLKCLSSWYTETADLTLVNKHVAALADSFRQLETFRQVNNNRQADENPMKLSEDDKKWRVHDLSLSFVRSSIAMAFEIMSSTVRQQIVDACGKWIKDYCPDEVRIKGTTAIIDNQPRLLQCLRKWTNTVDDPSKPTDRAIRKVEDRLQSFVQGDGPEERPYFAIGYASLMAHLGHYEAASSILNDWLALQADIKTRLKKDKGDSKKTDEAAVKLAAQDWLELRARSMLGAYGEEWLGREGSKVATVLQTEHLGNLNLLRKGLRQYLKRADFFQPLDEDCGERRCEIVFKRPDACASHLPQEELALWQKIFTSYVSIEFSYIDQTLRHPEYKDRYAESTNAAARRLANFDLSCGAEQPEPEVMYGQVLAVFAQNAISYSNARALTESAEARTQRLNKAERAAKFGLEIIESFAAKDKERSDKRYLRRIEPSVAVQTQERLKSLLTNIKQTKEQLED
jgi:hypothetical protein